MVKGQKQLSEAEVWDDSALVRSWDDALREYKVCFYILFQSRRPNVRFKLYHSIHARGERVEDVLKEIQQKPEVSGEALTANTADSVSVSEYRHDNGNGNCNVSDGLEDGELEETCEMAEDCIRKVRRISSNLLNNTH